MSNSFVATQRVLVLLLALEFRAAVGQEAKKPSLADANALVRAGIAAQQHGDNRSAIEDFQKALSVRPEMAEAHRNLGVALAAAGQLDAAIEEDFRALALGSDKTAVHRNLGSAYYKKGDMPRAQEQFEAVLAVAPHDISAAVQLGYVDIMMGREAKAVDLLTPLEPGHKSNLDLEYALAFSLIQTGKDKEGVPRMEKVAQATHRADAYVIAGAALLHRQDMSAAHTDLDAALRLKPSIPGLASMAGQACYALGDTKTATLDFQAALRQNPRDFNANLDLGVIRMEKRDIENAQPLLELALELEPGSPIARLEMARLKESTGRYTDAAAVLEDLVKAEPNWIHAHWELSTVYFTLNRPQEGKRERMIAQELMARQVKDEPEVKEPGKP